MAEELTVQNFFQQFLDGIDPSSSENINQSTNHVFSEFADTPTRRRNVILSKKKAAVKSLSSFIQGTSAIKHVVEDQHNPVLDAKFASFLVDVACESVSGPHGSPSTPTRYSSEPSSEIDEPIDRIENIIESLNVLKTNPFQLDDDGQTWMKRLDIVTLLPTHINKQTLPHLPSIILQKIIMQGQATMQRKKRARFHKSNSQSFEQKRVMIQKTNMILGYILTYYFLTELPGEVHFPSFISYLSELVLKTGFVEKSIHSNDYSAFFAGLVTCLLDCISLSIVAREQHADDASDGICLVMQGLSVAELNVKNFLDCFDINSVLTTILQITSVQTKRDLVTSIAKVMLDYTTSHHDDRETVKSQITDLYNFIDRYSSPDKAQVYLQKFNFWSKSQNAGQTVGMKRMNYSQEMSFDSILIEIQALLSIPNERAAIRLVQYTDEQKFIDFEHKQKTWYLLLDYLHQKDMLLNESRNSTFHMLTVGSSSGFESVLSFFKQLVVLVLDEINDNINERGGSPMTSEEEEWIRYHQHLVRRTIMKFCMRRAAYASNPLEIASNIAGMPLDEHDYFSVYETREQNIEYILNEVITTPERPLCLLGSSDDETGQQLYIEDSSDKVMHLDRNEIIPPSPANVPQNEEVEHRDEIFEENSNYSADQVAFNENSYQRNDAEGIIAIDSDDDDNEQQYDEEAAEDSQNLYTDGDYEHSEDEQSYEKSDSAIDIESSDEERSYEDEGAALGENDDEDDAQYVFNQENVATQNNGVINIESDDEEQVEDQYDNQVVEVDESDRYAYERQDVASNSENDEAGYGEEHYNSGEDYGVEGEDDIDAESANESDGYSSGRYNSGDDVADGENIIGAEREVDNDINGSEHEVYRHQDVDEGHDSGIETADEDNVSSSDVNDSENQEEVAANEGNISTNDRCDNSHQNNEIIAIDSDSEEDIYNEEGAIGDEAEGIEDNIYNDEDSNNSVAKKSADGSDGSQVQKSETEGFTDRTHDKIEIGSFEPASDGNEGGFLGHDSQSFSDGSAGYHDEERSGNGDFTGDSDSCDQDLVIRQDDAMGGGDREVMQIGSSEEEDNSPQSSDTSDDMIDADDTMDDGNETAEQGISHANEDYEFDVPVAPIRHSSRSKLSSSPKGPRKHYESQTDDAAVESENYYAEASGADTETSIEKTDDRQSPSYKITHTHLRQRKVVPSMHLPHANIENDDGNDADIENTEDEGISQRSKKEAKSNNSGKPEAFVKDREGVSMTSGQDVDEKSDKEMDVIASEEDKIVDEKATQDDLDKEEKEEASEVQIENMEETARIKAEKEEEERLRIKAEEEEARIKAEEEEEDEAEEEEARIKAEKKEEEEERLRIEAEEEEARIKAEQEEEEERLRIEAEEEEARIKAEEEERLRIEAEEEEARIKAEQEEEEERLRIEAEEEEARIKAEEEERLRIEAEEEEARIKAEQEEEEERLRIEAEEEEARIKAEQEEEEERLRIEAEEEEARIKAEEEERLRIEAEEEEARIKAEQEEEEERLRIEAEEEEARIKAEEEERLRIEAEEEEARIKAEKEEEEERLRIEAEEEEARIKAEQEEEEEERLRIEAEEEEARIKAEQEDEEERLRIEAEEEEARIKAEEEEEEERLRIEAEEEEARIKAEEEERLRIEAEEEEARIKAEQEEEEERLRIEAEEEEARIKAEEEERLRIEAEEEEARIKAEQEEEEERLRIEAEEEEARIKAEEEERLRIEAEEEEARIKAEKEEEEERLRIEAEEEEARIKAEQEEEEEERLRIEAEEEEARIKAEQEDEEERLRIEAEEEEARIKAEEEEEEERLRIEAEEEEARIKAEEEERLRIEAEEEEARIKAEQEEEEERLRIEAEEEEARIKAEEEERLRIEAEEEEARIKAEQEEEEERLRIEAEEEEARIKAEEEERLRIEAEEEEARIKAEKEEEEERLRIEAEEEEARIKAEKEEEERLRIEAEEEEARLKDEEEEEEEERLRIEAEEEAARIKDEQREQVVVQEAAGLKDSNKDEFSTMSYRKLQNECKKRNLSAKGSTNQLLDRLNQSHEEVAEVGDNQEEKEEASQVDNNSVVSDDFSTMSYKDLRSYCVAHGISAKGKKVDILERLRKSEEDTESENDDDSDDDEGNDDLSTISYRELQDMCKRNNLKASGKRDVLIDRLRNYNTTNVGDVSQPIKEEEDPSEDNDRKPSAYEQNKPKKHKTRTTFIENPGNGTEDKQSSTSMISKVIGYFSPKKKKTEKAMVEVTEILSSDDEEEGNEKVSTPSIPEHIKLEAPDSTVSAMNSPGAQSTVSALTVPGIGGSVANERKRRAGRPPKPPASSSLKMTQGDNEKSKRRKRSNSAASESSVRSTRSTRSQSRKK